MNGLEQKLKDWIEKERAELLKRKKKSNYKPELNYLDGRLDTLKNIEKEILSKY